MIQETRTYQCTRCGSSNIVKNGRTRYGSQKYHCKDCGAYRVLRPKVRYMEEQKELILRVYQERASLRALRRLFGVSIPTVLRWIQKSRLFTLNSRDIATTRRGECFGMWTKCAVLLGEKEERYGLGQFCIEGLVR